jgi:2-(1,2-epoxy-1,2-dihydrophenyl)acetyl-CoA isomerase
MIADPNDETEVELRRADGVATIVLTRPGAKNALTSQGWQQLLAALRSIETPRDRVVVVTGSGSDFCAGADMRRAPDPRRHPHEHMRTVNEAALALNRLPVPSVARVDGVAVGAGMNIALGCDFVVCSDRARFSQIFTQRGLSPDFGGSWLLPRLVGMAKAKELALLADIVSAETAAELGLAYRVVPVSELDDALSTLVERLRTGPTVALGFTRALLNSAFDTTLQQALDAEALALNANMRTEDVKEAARAFRDKRPANFTGR